MPPTIVYGCEKGTENASGHAGKEPLLLSLQFERGEELVNLGFFPAQFVPRV